MISSKMQRNYNFKPGRGSQMLEKLENKENNMKHDSTGDGDVSIVSPSYYLRVLLSMLSRSM